jgi:hypothetical protein
MAELSKEERMKLAIDAYNSGLFTSKTAAAKAFDVPPRTLMTRLNRTASWKEVIANCRKLTDLEESILKKWIIDMGQRGLPLQISTVHYLARLLLVA